MMRFGIPFLSLVGKPLPMQTKGVANYLAALALFRSNWCGMKRLRRRPLTVEEILNWADAHRETTGKWPTKSSGPILHARFENWLTVDNALRQGLRGLHGKCSLAQLLAEHRGAR